MKVGFIGQTHLGRTLRQATEVRGFVTTDGALDACNVVFVTPDVDDHDDLVEVTRCMEIAVDLPNFIAVVLVSQVPPGFTRPWATRRVNMFYQVDTIIMNRALERATYPERFIVGCLDQRKPLPAMYLNWLEAFECPIVKMSIESAELSKLAINYYLASQIEVANKLSGLASKIGADWNEMIPGLRLDKRIGADAYIVPGDIGGHLPRDIRTIEKLLRDHA